MRFTYPITIALAVLMLLTTAWMQSRAQQPAPAQAADERDAPILPLVVLKPGETKDLLLCSTCMRVTRGAGLRVRNMGTSYLDAKKTWASGGVQAAIIEPVPDEPAALETARLKSFIVRVTANQDAQPALLDMHLSDDTCAGDCHTDFRIVIVGPNATKPK